MTIDDIQRVELTLDELYTIKLYTDLYFPKGRVDQYDSQFHYKGEKRNPNWTGIVGEWAYYKMYSSYELWEFLKKRPIYKHDQGDGFIQDGIAVDIKTNVWKSKPTINTLDSDTYCANVETKHFEKHFIKIFIFTTFVIKEKCIYIMGWQSFRGFLDNGEYHEKGDQKPNGFVFPADAYDMKYSHLHPIRELPDNTIFLST